MLLFKLLLIIGCTWLISFRSALAFQSCIHNPHRATRHLRASTTLFESPKSITSEVDFKDLTVMDIVLFQRREIKEGEDAKLELGTLQETGTVAPISCWTTESAYTSGGNDMMEFVVDEEDMFPGLVSDDIRILQVLEGSVIGYGSRQVGGGKGLGNPHGEESELLYYIDRSVVEGVYDLETLETDGLNLKSLKIDLVVNPSLEVLW
jgi:hypothetical protein